MNSIHNGSFRSVNNLLNFQNNFQGTGSQQWMNAAKEKAHHAKSTSDASKAYCDKVIPFFGEVRSNIDALESIIDDNIWPMPKYREMLFIR